MGTLPVTDNKLVDFFDSLVKAGILGGEDAMKAYILTTPAAWLEGPVISVFTNEVLSLLGNAIYTQAADLVAKVVIDIQINLEKSRASIAVTQLQAAKDKGNADEIAKANAEFDAAMGSLLHYDGSAHPA